MRLTATLTTAAALEDVRERPSLRGQRDARPGDDPVTVLPRLPDGRVALARHLDEARALRRAAVAVLAADLELLLHVRVGEAVSHHLARGVAVDALHPRVEVDVGGDVSERAPLGPRDRAGQAAARRDERVVAVLEALVAQGRPAAPVVAPGARRHRREALHRVGRGVRPLSPDRPVAASVRRPVAVREVAGRAAARVPRRVRVVVRRAEMAAGAELPVQLARKAVESGHGGERRLRPVGPEPLAGLCGESDAGPLPLPRRLDRGRSSRRS